MSPGFEIRSSQYESDMASWCLDKTERLVSHVASVVDLLSKAEGLSEDVQAELPFHMNAVIYNATKLLAFSCGAEWTPADSELVRKKGWAGYQELSVKYKLL